MILSELTPEKVAEMKRVYEAYRPLSPPILWRTSTRTPNCSTAHNRTSSVIEQAMCWLELILSAESSMWKLRIWLQLSRSMMTFLLFVG